MTTTTIINCRYYDNSNQEVTQGCVQYANGVITHIGNSQDQLTAENTVNAHNHLLVPGFIDCYARLREPGYEKSATIASESLAAARNGITTMLCAPDTDPIIDEPSTVELIKRRAAAAIGVKVLPIGALTAGLSGEELSEMQILSDSGCVAFSNGDQPIRNTQVMRRVMEYSAGFNLNLIIAPQDPWLSGGVAHEGAVSTRLGLSGVPQAAETVALSQLIELCYQTGARVHFSRLSSQRGISLVNQAKKDNISVTADVGIDHLFLTEMDTSDFNSMCHTSPPFRSHTDREALREGLKSGVLDAISSNHAPHELDAKQVPYADSLPGTSSLDSFTALLFKLSTDAKIPLPILIDRVTAGPARCFDLSQGQLSVGAPADLSIINTDEDWEFSTTDMLSQGKNSPYEGWDFQSRVELTVVNGNTVYASRKASV